jgi:16S rRNA (cytosine1402-N4)-methyltransferase
LYIKNGQLELVRTNFRDITSAIRGSKLAANGLVDGVLMDLGISSHQIGNVSSFYICAFKFFFYTDEPGRGFAFAADGPLDMRMGRVDKAASDTAFTAATIVNEYDQDSIANILYQYG